MNDSYLNDMKVVETASRTVIPLYYGDLTNASYLLGNLFSGEVINGTVQNGDSVVHAKSFIHHQCI